MSTITLVSSFSPGGETAQYAQAIAKYIAYHSGHRVNLTYIPGDNGGVALKWMAQQPKDGMTLVTAQTPFFVTLPMYPGCPYKLADVSMISWSAFQPYVIFVHVDSPIHTWPELLQAAKEAKGMAVPGVSQKFVHESLIQQCPEAKWLQFQPIESSATLIKMLRDHTVSAIWSSPVVYLMNKDVMRPIIVGADITLETLSRVPLFSQYGIDIKDGTNRGLAVSADVPEEAQRRVSEWVGNAATNISFIREIQALGFMPKYIAYPETNEFTRLKYSYYHALLFPQQEAHQDVRGL
eukprot:m51a1_g10313 hypothetical protein (294) ;mRNA; r:50-1278